MRPRILVGVRPRCPPFAPHATFSRGPALPGLIGRSCAHCHKASTPPSCAPPPAWGRPPRCSRSARRRRCQPSCLSSRAPDCSRCCLLATGEGSRCARSLLAPCSRHCCSRFTRCCHLPRPPFEWTCHEITRAGCASHRRPSDCPTPGGSRSPRGRMARTSASTTCVCAARWSSAHARLFPEMRCSPARRSCNGTLPHTRHSSMAAR